MRLRKRTFIIIFILFLLACGVGGGIWLSGEMNAAWNNPKTWGAESKVILPAEAVNLKVVNQLSDIPNTNKKQFEFETEYCYLYAIEPAMDDQSATLKCSLLPMYYIDRAKEVPNDWQEKSDIQLIVHRNDKEPVAFLGRQDLSFDSVRSLGTDKYPVKMKIVGEYTYPEETLSAKLQHYLTTRTGAKQSISAEVTEFSVERLDNPYPPKVKEYAKNWLTEVKKSLTDKYVQQALIKKESTEFLRTAHGLFNQFRVRCTKLETCVEEYETNPASNFAFMLYGAERWNRDLFLSSVKAMKADLFPFTGAAERPNPADYESEDSSPWKVFSAYEFPVCPVNDLITGKKSESFKILETYLSKEKAFENSPLSLSELTTLLSSEQYSYKFLTQERTANGAWEVEKIFAINEACERSMEGETTAHLELRKKVVSAFYAMLSQYIGKEVTGATENLEELIYEGNAYSPYTNRFLSDYDVSRFRETGIQTNEEAAKVYTEWKSVLASYIILYLYDARE